MEPEEDSEDERFETALAVTTQAAAKQEKEREKKNEKSPVV